MDHPKQKVGAVQYSICNAKNRSGGRCKLPAGYQTNHPGYGSCVRHYGNTPSAKKAAAQQEVRETVFAKLGTQHPTMSPEDALLGEVRRSAAAVMFFDDTVEAITPEMLGDPGDVGYSSRAWVTVWRQERKHLAEVAALALRAGIEERLVKATEAQAEGMVRVLLGVIRELGLSEEQQLAARRALAGGLRELEQAS